MAITFTTKKEWEKVNETSKKRASNLLATLQDTEEREKNAGGGFGGFLAGLFGYAPEKFTLGTLRGVEGAVDSAAIGSKTAGTLELAKTQQQMAGMNQIFALLTGSKEAEERADDYRELANELQDVAIRDTSFEEAVLGNDWVNYNHADEWFNPGDGWKVVGDVAHGVGSSLPHIAINIAGGPIIGTVASFAFSATSGMGMGMSEAYKETGKFNADTMKYGALTGLTEAGTELASDLLGYGSGAVIKAIRGAATSTAAKVAKEATESLFKASVQGGVKGTLKAVGKGVLKTYVPEALEEAFSAVMEPLYKRWTYDPNAQYDWRAIFYEAFIGGLSGVFMGGATNAIIGGASAVNNISRGATIAQGGAAKVQEQFDLAETVIKTAEDKGYEGTEYLQALLDKTRASVAKYDGEATSKASQLLLGELQLETLRTAFGPRVVESMLRVVENAPALAEYYNALEYRDADGKLQRLSADEIRGSITEEMIKSTDPKVQKQVQKTLFKELGKNSALMRLAILDMANSIVADNNAMAKEVARGERDISAEQWNNIVDRVGEEGRAELEYRLGIDIRTADVADVRAAVEAMQVAKELPETDKTLPKSVSDSFNGAKRYNLKGHGDVAIIRIGNAFYVYDYAGDRLVGAPMSLQELNKILRNHAAWEAKTKAEQEKAPQSEAEENKGGLNKDAQVIADLLNEKIPSYKDKSVKDRATLRRIYRQGVRNGLTSDDAVVFTAVAARSGLNIVFDRERCFFRDENGVLREGNGFYSDNRATIVINPTKAHELVLIHELDHSLRTEHKNGKTTLRIDEEAIKEVPEDIRKQIESTYKKVDTKLASKEQMYKDEQNAYYAEMALGNMDILRYLVDGKPALMNRILSFFKKASTDYKGVPKLEGYAKKYLKEYQKAFEAMAEENRSVSLAETVDDVMSVVEDGGAQYALIGRTQDGRGIYKSNYPKNTPRDVKQRDIVNLVQNVWSEKPIKLNIVEEGKIVPIEAKFNPELSERSDLSKIAFGNRKGTASDKRITLNLSSDLYQIAEESHHVGSKTETGKENPTHSGVTKWHYFLTDLVYVEEDGTAIDCHMNIDVKQNDSGHWFYSFAIEKGSRPADVLSVVTDKSATTSTISIPDPAAKVNPSEEKSEKKVEGKRSDPAKAQSAKISGKMSDAQFSLAFAPAIAESQRKFVETKKSNVTYSELEKAISDTAKMVDIMQAKSRFLPEDKVGKTLVKNGSYDVSVENTTICVRTLAYNSFVDMVSEKIGRPLTQMESFLVSQKLYEIAKEPQCLYCYVSLDRKAYNDMVIRYVEQRDAAIKAYEDAGKPRITRSSKLYEEFRNGRKDTDNMWDRYNAWITSYNNGDRLITLEDVSTEAKRAALARGTASERAQVADVLKYAQSASWAKKQTQYVAYNGDILKLGDRVVRDLNKHYGLRWYSFSDYSGAFIVENMQQITDASVRGLKGLAYTKDTDFVKIFAPTGMNINISVYAKKVGDHYEIDPLQSANLEEAIKLREQYPNVGIVITATDRQGVEWALAQEWSDCVIPFHTVRTGADVAEFYNWDVFNAEQGDVVEDQNLWDAYVDSLNVSDTARKKVSKLVYPSEHQNNRDTYLRICKERGLKPRFSSFLDNPNYMKLVVETRKSEAETAPLKPVFNVNAAKSAFSKFVDKGGYYEGWYNDGIDVDAEADIVASDVLAGKKANEVSYGRQDIDTEGIQRGRRSNREHGRRFALPLEPLTPDEQQAQEEIQREIPTKKRGKSAKERTEAKLKQYFSTEGSYEMLRTVYGLKDLSPKSIQAMNNQIWQALNASVSADEKALIAWNTAGFILDRMMTTDLTVENPAAKTAMEELAYLRTGVGRLKFADTDVAELKHAFGKDGMAKIRGRWGYKGKGAAYPMEQFVVDIAREMPGMAYIEEMHPAEAFKAIMEKYDTLLEASEEPWISELDGASDIELDSIRNGLAQEILDGFDYLGAESSYARLENQLETFRTRAERYKLKNELLQDRSKAEMRLMRMISNLRDVKVGRFANATQPDMTERLKSVFNALLKIDFRGTLSVGAVRSQMRELSAWYEDAKTNIIGYQDENNPGLYNGDIYQAMLGIAGKTDADKITNQEIKDLFDIVSYFRNVVQNYGKVVWANKLVEAEDLAKGYIAHYDPASAKVGNITVMRAEALLRRWRDYSEDIGVTMFRADGYREGGFFVDMHNQIREAEAASELAQIEALKAHDEFLDANKGYLTKASKEIVKIDGGEITKMHLISLYMTCKRQQAWRGIALNGYSYTIPGTDRTVEFYDGVLDKDATEAEIEAFIQTKLAAIEKHFSDKDKEYIHILESAYNGTLRDMKMKRDFERQGYSNVADGYYYPIKRGAMPRTAEKQMQEAYNSFNNSAFNKNTVEKASQELTIEPAEALFQRHVKAVSNYAHVGAVVDTFNAVFNLDTSGNKNRPTSLATVTKNHWARAHEYFVNLFSDIKGTRMQSELGHALGNVRSKYAVAALSANPKVWVTQLSSLFASTNVLDWGSIAQAIRRAGSNNKVDESGLREVDKYCPLARLRNHDNTAAKAQGLIDRVGKVGEVLMTPIGKMDRLVILIEWRACQAQIAKTMGEGYEIGTEKNKTEAGKLLTKVIQETQQSSLKSERTAAMRSTSEVMRSATMFTADAVKVAGRVVSAMGEIGALNKAINNAKDADTIAALKEQRKGAKKRLGRACVSLGFTSMYMAALSYAFNAFFDRYGDDEPEEVIKDVAGDVFAGFFSGVPIFKDVLGKIIDGFDMSDMTFDVANDIIQAATSAVKLIGDKDKTSQDAMSAVKNLVIALSQALGLPTRNIYNYTYGTLHVLGHFGGGFGGSMRKAKYEVDDFFKEKNLRTELDKALDNDDDVMVDYILGLIGEDSFGSGFSKETTKKLRDLAKNDYAVLPRELKSKVTINGVEYKLTDKQIATLSKNYRAALSEADALVASAAFQKLDIGKQQAALQELFSVTYDSALCDTLDIAEERDVLVSRTIGGANYALYAVKTRGIKATTVNGVTVSGSKRKKVVAAINELPLSDVQKLLLICKSGYSIADGDIKGKTAESSKQRLAVYLNAQSLDSDAKKELAEMCNFSLKNGKFVVKKQ